MTYDELQKKIFSILPDAEFDVNDEGQIVIFTGKRSKYTSPAGLYIELEDFEA